MVRNCRLKVECWISGHREAAERIITMKLGYLELNKIAARWPAKAVAQFYFY